ncbi:MAG: hypothetical protein IPI24_08105 [Ignavibacteria bacterium]|nr:hypothetical protein [Ignavibacteria bacterium]MBK7577381.1 hypothetical protein [Ignavibacteria bacterium]MBK9183267.1 hypothetical protein [Ignavibacteria bacterium]
MRKVVGISQKTRRAWLDAGLDLLVQTTNEAELRELLDKYLIDDLPGKESRAKSAGIVLRIWSSIPPKRVSIRDRALALLPQISGQERIWLHWGMAALAYPFFRDTAEVVGRLLWLQDSFTTKQVQNRIVPVWGDRTTVTEATQKLITSFIEWGVLHSSRPGHLEPSERLRTDNEELELWLLHALLAANPADEIELNQLWRLPESFPFCYSLSVADIRGCGDLEIHRQGFDMNMVVIRK